MRMTVSDSIRCQQQQTVNKIPSLACAARHKRNNDRFFQRRCLQCTLRGGCIHLEKILVSRATSSTASARALRDFHFSLDFYRELVKTGSAKATQFLLAKASIVRDNGRPAEDIWDTTETMT